MKFLLITHVEHKKKGNTFFAYEPYVREMNLWFKYVDTIKIIAPFTVEKITKIDIEYIDNNILYDKIPSFNLLNFKNSIESFFKIPFIIIKIMKGMIWADHIHIRCPGNVGLLACFAQILFPSKQKTVKYAGNWNIKDKQPLSYRVQKWILSNTFLTRNCKVLVYGKWDNQTKNIIPFFTASYSQNEIIKVEPKNFKNAIKLIYVGSFSKGKQPLKSIQVAKNLYDKGFNIELNMYGNGIEFKNAIDYIDTHTMNHYVFLHGNQPKEIVKEAFKESHFLVFISKSEGWPKVVAEAMFWSCLPISTRVSCVPYMLDYGKRGAVVSDNVTDIVAVIKTYINNINLYQEAIINARDWSQYYTLEKFEFKIGELL